VKKIFLHGKIAKEFGESFNLEVSSPKECITAIDSQTEGFRKYLAESALDGIVYGIRDKDGNFFNTELYSKKTNEEELHFAAIPQGGAFLTTLLTAAATTYIGLWLQDLFKIDEPQPGQQIFSESYIYNGPRSQTVQGGAVPVGYGRLRIGPTNISDIVLNYDYDVDRGEIMGFGVDTGGVVNAAEYFIGSSIYSFTAVKKDSAAAVQGAYVYSPRLGINPYSAKGDAGGGQGWDGSDANQGVANYAAGDSANTNDTEDTFQAQTQTKYGVQLEAATADSCITQTFPINPDGSVNILNPTASASVMLDTSQKYRATNRNGNSIIVGPRYRGANRDSGMGYTSLNSTSVRKKLHLLSEGPIEGLVDQNGKIHEYNWTNPESDTSFAKGIYVNDIPVKDTTTDGFNIGKIDFDLTTTAARVSIPPIEQCEDPSSKFIIGAGKQRLLRKEYLYSGITFGKNARLYGPRKIATKKDEEEYFISHIVTNPDVSHVMVGINVLELYYVYEGDHVEVRIKLGSLLGALAGAIIATMLTGDAMGDVTLVAAMAGIGAGLGKAAVAAKLSTGYTAGTIPLGSAAAVAEAYAIAAPVLTWATVILSTLAGSALGAIIGNNLELYSGRKIENSGETWPNKLKFRIKVSNDGQHEYETNIQLNGVATEPYVKDFLIPLPASNPNKSNRIVKIYRTTRQKNIVSEGESAARYREEAEVHSITEIIPAIQNFPKTVVAATRLNARDSPNQQADISFDLKLKKVKVPSNYNPETRVYNGVWDGLFFGESEFEEKLNEKFLKWTDNPAWIFYDIVTNDVFGLGKFGIDGTKMDRWNLYKIAKFCDEMVPTGILPKYDKRFFSCENPEFPKQEISIIGLNDNQFRQEFRGIPAAELTLTPDGNFTIGKQICLFYDDERNIGEKFTIINADLPSKTITLDRPPKVGRGSCAIEYSRKLLEPRFTCNFYINKAQDAFSLIKRIAEIFRSTPYWADGAIFLSQERKDDPVMLFNNNNIGNNGFAYSSSPRSQRYNYAAITYADQESLFLPQIEYSENRDGIIRDDIKEISPDGFGITSKGQAKRKVTHTIKKAEVDNELIQFNTDAIGSYLRPGDLVKIADKTRTSSRMAGKILRSKGSNDEDSLIIDIDYPTKISLDPLDPKTWKNITLYTPSLSHDFNHAKDINYWNQDQLDKFRSSQVSNFYITGISNPGTEERNQLKIKYNPYEYVDGAFSFHEAIDDAIDKGGRVARVSNSLDQNLLELSLPSGQSAWIGGRAIEPLPNWIWQEDNKRIEFLKFYNVAPPAPDFSKFKLYTKVTGEGDVGDQNYGAVILNSGSIAGGYILEKFDTKSMKIADSTSYIIDCESNLSKDENYRVVNIKEDNPGVFVVNAIKYNKSVYNTIEKSERLKTNSIPNIETETPLDPGAVNFLINPVGAGVFSLNIQFDVITGTNFYNIDIINEDNIQVRSFTVNNNDARSSITKIVNNVNLDPGGYFARVTSNL